MLPQVSSQRRKPLGPSWAIGGVLFRHKAEITIISEADAAAGPRGKTRFFPDLFRAPGGVPAGAKYPRKTPLHKRAFLPGWTQPQPTFVLLPGAAAAQCLGSQGVLPHHSPPLVQRGDSMAWPCWGEMCIRDRAKILPRRMTGTCAMHQRQLTEAIKRARHLALLPYTSD